MANFDIRQLLAGLGLLVFGMSIFEESVKSLSTKTVKRILGRYTHSAFKSIITGTLATALLQSSSLVSLILLGFVGAGVLQLTNAIGIIIGANIGTTVSSIIVAQLGFGDFSISAFALPMIAIGGIILIFAKHKRWIFAARLLVGFGLLFLGLDFMKESVDALKASFSLSNYGHGGLPLFFVIGLIVTAIIQSSSAVGVMTLAAINAGIIDFPSSVAIIMGANIGTTFTGVLASLGGKAVKRQLALSHVLFNLSGTFLGITFFRQYIWFVNDILGLANDPIMGNAVLNVVFNLCTALVFAPLLTHFSRLVLFIIPNRNGNALHLSINKFDTDSLSMKESLLVPAQIYSLLADSKEMIAHAIRYNCYPRGFGLQDLQSGSFKDIESFISGFDVEKHDQEYELNQQRADYLFQFIAKIRQVSLSSEEITPIDNCYNAILACIRSMKAIKNIRHNILALRQSDDKLRQELYVSLKRDNIHLYKEVTAIIAEGDDQRSHLASLRQLIGNIKDWYSYYATMITGLSVDEDNGEADLASLINLHREFYQSVLSLSRAIQFLYLSKEERVEL